MILKDVSSFELYTFKTPDGYDEDSYTAGVVKVLEDLDALPEINPKDLEVHAKWIHHRNKICLGSSWECSNCHLETCLGTPRRCSRCDAIMDEEESK